MSKKNFTTKDLKSGYVVETRDGSRFLVTRTNQNRFIKVITNKSRFINLNSYDEDLRATPPMDPDTDIVKVWGLSDDPLKAVCMSDISERPLLWERPKELLNCKICVTKIDGDCTFLTVGKIYEIKDGLFINDNGSQYPADRGCFCPRSPLESVDDLKKYFSKETKGCYTWATIDFVVVVED